MSKVSIPPKRPIYPSPAALITSIDSEGKPNIITLAEVFNLSIAQPVIVGIAIAKPRYSHQLIRESGEFVVNLPTADMVRTVDRCGTVSGRDVNKFEEFELTPIPAEQVRPPLIAECPVNIECRVLEIEEIGDHDLFKGEVLAQHVDEACLDAHGRIRIATLNPLNFILGEYWSIGKRLGHHGYTRT